MTIRHIAFREESRDLPPCVRWRVNQNTTCRSQNMLPRL